MTGEVIKYQRKWFSAANPVNKQKASKTIGSGDNGVVTIVADAYGTGGNAYSIEVVVGQGNNVAMSAALEGTKITVTLGTGVAGAVDNTKNTATLIAAAINALAGVSATASGTGATAFTQAVAEANLAGGTLATPCRYLGTIVKDNTYYYVCTTAGGANTTVWKRFTLATY